MHPTPAPDGSAALVDDLRGKVFSEVSSLGLGHRPWTVVDYPNHLNCGDAALYLGLEAIAAHLGAPLRRVLDRQSYDRALVDPESVVVVQAGGNWGGLYPTHHRLRLRLLSELRGRKVVQLAQSIEYPDDAARDELRRAVAEHGDVTLFVRDRRSHALAVRDYDCDVRLVPDTAFALGPLRRYPSTSPLRVQVRTDREGTGDAHGFAPDQVFDWLTVPRWSAPWLVWKGAGRVSRLQRRTATPLVGAAGVRAAHMLAAHSLRRATGLLSAGELVVTDRLHGHLLCTLLSIPHVVVNDRYGKIEALRETWTSQDAGHEFVASWDEVPTALETLRERVSATS